ncbi:MAG: nucleotidyltransferase domain-containing protein [Chloroflexota bacterium]|nr:nucleotidyltransferase domain-containing protein [Chloroflexota bacterium]MDQ5867126.1 nucleotidyltransferase domain-containing protein [Chloroflexota bacterium]
MRHSLESKTGTPPTLGPLTIDLSLDEVVARLSGKPAVDGILVMGSGVTGDMHPASDYDLFVVLSDMPSPLYLVATEIDHHFAEIYFGSVEKLEGYLAAEPPLHPVDIDAAVIRWLQTGRIAFDRYGLLSRAQSKFRQREWQHWFEPQSGLQLHQTWFSVNYNLVQTQRMLASPDPVYATTVDLRLLYTVMEVWQAYFRLRGLPSLGEKHDIRYLAANDPEYLDLFRCCLAEPDRARKFELYRRLADIALAPLGGLWQDGTTAMQFRGDKQWQPDTVDKALAFWQELVTE